MLDPNVVLLGYSNQRVHQRTCYGGLACHQLDYLRRRYAEQVKRKIVQNGRAQKIRKRAQLLVEPNGYQIVIAPPERFGYPRDLFSFGIFLTVLDLGEIRS